MSNPIHSTTTSFLGGSLNTKTLLAIGYFSELGHFPVSMPIETVVTCYQSSGKRLDPITKKSISFLKVLEELWSQAGLAAFYRGWPTYFYTPCLNAIQFTVFDLCKKAWFRRTNQKTLSALAAFMLGAVARAVATIIVFPIIRVKVRMQAGIKTAASETGDKKQQQTLSSAFTQVPRMLSQLYSKDGWQGLYGGLQPALARGVLSAALMLMIKEKVREQTRTLLHWMKKNGKT